MSYRTQTAVEAQQIVYVEFSFQTFNTGTISIHMANCGTNILIRDLKCDFESMFGDPDGQEWYSRTTKLADNKALYQYGITGRDGHTVKIYVRQSKKCTWP